jgi:hypothetical protein
MPNKMLVICASVIISACTTLPFEANRIELGPDQIACVGIAPDTIGGFTRIKDDALMAKALGESGKGGVCSAQVFLATSPGVVYRVYDGEKGASNYGKWWAFERPTGPREAYRAEYGICEEWSGLDRLIACEVKVGSEVVVGTTQSVSCKTTSYPKTDHIQVFIPNDRASEYLAVENCTEIGQWP